MVELVSLQGDEETKVPPSFLSLSVSLCLSCEATARRQSFTNQELSPDTKQAGTLIVDLSASRTRRNERLLVKPDSL